MALKRKTMTAGEAGLYRYRQRRRKVPETIEELREFIEQHNAAYNLDQHLEDLERFARAHLGDPGNGGERVTVADLAEHVLEDIEQVRSWLARGGDPRSAIVDAMRAQRRADQMASILLWEHPVAMHRRLRNPKGKGPKEEAAIGHEKWLEYARQLVAGGEGNISEIARKVADKFLGTKEKKETVRSVLYRKKLLR